ncbi:hypothetical protein AAFF_G00402770 [Aldrovandia affinis]|uniref:Uncharacterized protein n=1 Tax=Aldrovandia affinis TaxID=143900 RepID=A0AAD7T7H2_9TELE|nr:hypothetical protein AAFF_G00402770 [Aldrovandia affinis]
MDNSASEEVQAELDLVGVQLETVEMQIGELLEWQARLNVRKRSAVACAGGLRLTVTAWPNGPGPGPGLGEWELQSRETSGLHCHHASNPWVCRLHSGVFYPSAFLPQSLENIRPIDIIRGLPHHHSQNS